MITLSSMIPNDKKIVYVTREIERALGLEPGPNYRIVSNMTSFGETVRKRYPDFVTLVVPPQGKLLGTTELLSTRETADILASDPSLNVLVFKNTLRVEAAVKAAGKTCLNPRSELSERVENKLSQLRWLGPLASRLLPPHGVKVAKYITWKGADPFVIQWAHGHTGDGTILIDEPDKLRTLLEKFPDRMARITSFISGPSFTVNAVVTPKRIMMGNVSYQITGLEPFTNNRFSTVGNDWGAARAMLSPDDMKAIEGITAEIGGKLQSDGWKGLFGLDFIRDEKRGRMYLIEVNARQPASATFESTLEEEMRRQGRRGVTIFEAHIRALLDLPIDEDIIAIDDGAQIVQRITTEVQSVFDEVTDRLTEKGYATVAYQNTDPNSDLVRIQSNRSIMAAHNSWNERGKEIAEIIRRSHFKINI